MDEFLLSLLAASLFIGAYFALAYIIGLRRKKQIIEKVSKKIEDLKEMVYVDYRGFEIPMTKAEKNTVWRNLTKKGKDDALAAWKKHLKIK